MDNEDQNAGFRP